MIEQNNTKYYTMHEVSQLTGVNLITVYRRARKRDVDVITHEGKKLLSEDSFDIIKKVGSPGRPMKKDIDKAVDIG
jgi:hypothetical protein